jgi:hypothetical protein
LWAVRGTSGTLHDSSARERYRLQLDADTSGTVKIQNYSRKADFLVLIWLDKRIGELATINVPFVFPVRGT